MANLFDYLTWRGDLTFAQAPLNEVDCLIFSRFSYLQLDNIVPTSFTDTLTLEKCWQKYQAQKTTPYLQQATDEALLETLAKCQRFKNIELCGFRNDINAQAEKQFACLTFKFLGSNLIAYRGTDDTLVGLKEDFNMSFMQTVPCQSAGLNYFKDAAKALDGPFYLAGHSKGGNIALFVALFCPDKLIERLKHVYSFDGPGFAINTLERADIKRIKPLISAYVPQSSIIGMLLGHVEDYTVVHSQQTSILQHDLYSWDIAAPHSFVCEKNVDTSSVFIEQTLKDWLNEISNEKRQEFISVVFDVLNATQITRMQELTADRFSKITTVVSELTQLDKKQRALVLSLAKSLLQTGIKNRSVLKDN